MGRIILDGPSFDNTPPPAGIPNAGKPPTPAKAGPGSNGGTGRWYGTDGDPGTDGRRPSPAQNGTTGLDGGDASSLTIIAANLTVDPSMPDWFSARGGNAGPGGKALTPGGDGGEGGDGGAGWGLGRGGNGGNGGSGRPGASGGNGGRGGNGGNLTINLSGVFAYSAAMVAGGRGGLPGTGGLPGVGGAGGKGGAGPFGPSPDGDAGYSPTAHTNNGVFGNAGSNGKILINGVRVV